MKLKLYGKKKSIYQALNYRQLFINILDILFKHFKIQELIQKLFFYFTLQ